MVENRGHEHYHLASKGYQNVLGLMIELEKLFSGEEKIFLKAPFPLILRIYRKESWK